MRGTRASRSRTLFPLLVAALVVGITLPGPAHAATALEDGDVAGIVRDSTTGEPLANAELSVMRMGRLVVNTESDQFGHFIVHHVPSGEYVIDVRMIGFRAERRAVAVTPGGRV